MCPICILTSILYGICSILSLLGLKNLVKYIKLRYHLWSGTKCEKCKGEGKCQSHN